MILLTGGRGKTSSRIAEFLSNASIPFAIASRTPSSDQNFNEVRFDWLDSSTYPVPFESAKEQITAIYLVAPPVLDLVPSMKAFIDFALQQGVKRFVLLSSSAIPAGGPAHGQIHQYLIDSGADFGVCRPSWFMENFSEMQHYHTIRAEAKMYSATGDRKIPFVSAEDIAAVAFRLLTDEKPHNRDYFIRGPNLLSYDDVASLLSKVRGDHIEHIKLTVPQLQARFVSNGMPEDYAAMLSGLDGYIASGAEEHLDDTVEQVTGRKPKRFAAFVEENRSVWL